MSRNDILVFTKLISQYLDANIPLKESLKKISEIRNIQKNVSLAAFEIELQMEKGTIFSLALKECCLIHFPKVYIAFISSSEKVGNLRQTFLFLLERENNIYKRKSDLISICVYPIVVVLMAFVGSILLIKFGANLVPNITGTFDELAFKNKAILGCVKANIFLFSFFAIGLYVLKKTFGSNFELDLFRALFFLISGGIDLHYALVTSMSVVENTNSCEKKLVNAISSLENGQSISKAFEYFGKYYSTYFCIAEDCNDLTKTMKNIVQAGEEKEKRISKRIMEYVEPCVMSCVAVYIIILLKNIVMPVMFNYGF